MRVDKFQAVLKVLQREVTKEEIYLEYNISEQEYYLWERQFLAAAKEALQGVEEVSQQMTLDSTLWHTPAFSTGSLPEFYAHEYRRIHELLAVKEPYGALLQIKDFYEILLKFPILATISFWLSRVSYNDLAIPCKQIIFRIISERLSLGKWLDIARDILKFQKQNILQVPENHLNTILQTVYKLYDDYNVVNWRNKYIGHGALGSFEDEAFQQEFSNQLKYIRNHLSASIIETLYSKLNIYNTDKKSNISIHDYTFYINPFMYIENEELLLFEGFDEVSGFVEYLNYRQGKKKAVKQEALKVIFDDYILSQQQPILPMQKLDFAYKEDVRAFENRLTFLDFIQPSYLLSWIINVTKTKQKGYLYLVMEEGMGKTTLVQAMDELKLHKWDHPKIMCRAVYFNNYSINQIQTLKEDMITSFSKVVMNGLTKTLNSYFSFPQNNTLDPQQFHSVLTDCFSRLKTEIGKEKLIFILDGLDELLGTHANHLLEVLSEMPPLPDGLFILLTAKFHENNTIKIPSELQVETKIVRENDDVNKKLLLDFSRQKLKFKGDEAHRFIEQLEDKRMLLIQPYAIIRKRMPEVKLHSISDLLSHYLRYMRQLYGDKYYIQITELATLLSFSPKSLNTDEIAFLLTGGNSDFGLLGVLQDMKYWLNVRKKKAVNTYTIVKTSVREAIKDLDFYHENLEMISSRWLRQAEADFSTLERLPSYIGLLYEFISRIPYIKFSKAYKERLPIVARHYYETAETYSEIEQAIKLFKIERNLLASTEAAYYVSEGYMKILDYDQALLELDNLFPILVGKEKTSLYFKTIQLQWLLMKKLGFPSETDELLKLNIIMYKKLKTNKKNALYMLRQASNTKKVLSLEHIRKAIKSKHQHLVFYYEYLLLQIRVFATQEKAVEMAEWSRVLAQTIREKSRITIYDHIVLCYLDGLLLGSYTLLLAKNTKTLEVISFEFPISCYIQNTYIFNDSFITNYYEYFDSLQKALKNIENLKKEIPLLNEQAFIIMPELHMGLFKFEGLSRLTMYHRIEAERFFKRMLQTSYNPGELSDLQIQIDAIETNRFITKKYALNKILESIPDYLHQQTLTEFYHLLVKLPVSEEKFIVGTELLAAHNTMLKHRLEAIPEILIKELHYMYAILESTLLPSLLKGRFLFEYACMSYYNLYKYPGDTSLVQIMEVKVLDLFMKGFTVLKQAIHNGCGMEDYHFESILKYVYRITFELKHNGHEEHPFIEILDLNKLSVLHPKFYNLTRDVDE
ncbi:hypothetical protein [Priestia megaterium]|uniref:hypothetical protein n=1 Tax=Priestia megaterium TaxID=1404 RepID=UPI0011A9DD4B|nr:hypothetical protein [Priestia megaterium]